MTPQEIKTNNMEEQTLYDKIYDQVRGYLMGDQLDEIVDITRACHRVAIQEQIKLLQELAKDTENTNANFRLKLIVKINELENKLI
jgi:hypothetical protein